MKYLISEIDKSSFHISIQKNVFDLSLFFYQTFIEPVFRHHNC
jgi:hypothetical protein